jgi:hypothetical protein
MNRKHIPPAVRRIMRKHGLSEPVAWTYAYHANGEAALHG